MDSYELADFMNTEHAAKLEEILNGISPLNQPIASKLIHQGSFKTYKENEVVFSERKYNAFEYFQIEGVSHRFNTNDDGQLITTGIYSGGLVITPNFARTINGRSIFSLQALTECIYLKIPIGAFDELRKQNSQLWTLGQRVIEKEFIRHLN